MLDRAAIPFLIFFFLEYLSSWFDGCTRPCGLVHTWKLVYFEMWFFQVYQPVGNFNILILDLFPGLGWWPPHLLLVDRGPFDLSSFIDLPLEDSFSSLTLLRLLGYLQMDPDLVHLAAPVGCLLHQNPRTHTHCPLRGFGFLGCGGFRVVQPEEVVDSTAVFQPVTIHRAIKAFHHLGVLIPEPVRPRL